MSLEIEKTVLMDIAKKNGGILQVVKSTSVKAAMSATRR